MTSQDLIEAAQNGILHEYKEPTMVEKLKYFLEHAKWHDARDIKHEATQYAAKGMIFSRPAFVKLAEEINEFEKFAIPMNTDKFDREGIIEGLHIDVFCFKNNKWHFVERDKCLTVTKYVYVPKWFIKDLKDRGLCISYLM